VGGGRDILSALWGGNDSITGIEINKILLDLLNGPYRGLASIAAEPRVRLVNDEARSYLTRAGEQFDILQMSLIDTWASTGAGAFSLTENGLYTREAWGIFLDSLRPGGIFSVSRWFSPTAISETNRLVALGTAALLDRGVIRPDRQLILLTRHSVATMLVSTRPFTEEDHRRIAAIAERFGFSVLIGSDATGRTRATERLRRMAASRSLEELDTAAADPTLDFSPPTDERPYFFNVLKPGGVFDANVLPRGGVIWGNVRATVTLTLLFAIACVLVAAIILWPLVRSGLPAMDGRTFTFSVAYFAAIGAGFMLIQIGLLQRFSVYLGHPTYTLAIILFTMILSMGAGSWLSDRFSFARHRWLLWVPLAAATTILLVRLGLQPLTNATTHFELVGRSLVVIGFVAPLAVLLGFCFPLGMRLVGRISDHATAWMWGVNGACGVMASIAAVAISMWVGIQANLLLGAGLYLALLWPTHALARRGASVDMHARKFQALGAKSAAESAAP
jgi:hypothetical protein